MDDKDTSEVLSQADHVQSMLNSDGWKVVYDKLQTKIIDLQNISNIDMTKPETLGVQLAARRMAVDLIWAWLKGDVVGFVDQQKLNNQKMSEKIDSFIERET